MGCTINGRCKQKINPGHGWLQTPGGLEPGPGRVGTGKGAASRGGRGNPAGAQREPNRGGTGWRAGKAGGNASQCGQAGEKALWADTEKKAARTIDCSCREASDATCIGRGNASAGRRPKIRGAN